MPGFSLVQVWVSTLLKSRFIHPYNCSDNKLKERYSKISVEFHVHLYVSHAQLQLVTHIALMRRPLTIPKF